MVVRIAILPEKILVAFIPVPLTFWKNAIFNPRLLEVSLVLNILLRLYNCTLKFAGVEFGVLSIVSCRRYGGLLLGLEANVTNFNALHNHHLCSHRELSNPKIENLVLPGFDAS